MINEIRYTNIRVILDNLLQNDLLKDLTLEQVVGYTVKFNGILNIPQLYNEKTAILKVEDYRALLPCDLISIKQVRETSSNVAMRQISGTFFNPNGYEFGFKTQGTVIYTTFKNGEIEIVYNAIPVDEDGYPLIMDDEKYKNALELYIKKHIYTNLFDVSRINQNVLQNVQQEYSWAVGQLSNSLKMPSISQMESLSNAHNQLLVKQDEFKRGFETLGIKEQYKIH